MSNQTKIETGVFGIRNFNTPFNGSGGINQGSEEERGARGQWLWANSRQRWTIKVEPAIGSIGHRYSPIHGTDPDSGYINSVNDDAFRRALRHDATDADRIVIVEPSWEDREEMSQNPAIWETDPKDAADIDIYYQASGLNPLYLNKSTIETYIPLGSTFKVYNSGFDSTQGEPFTVHTVKGLNNTIVSFTPVVDNNVYYAPPEEDDFLRFTKRDCYDIKAVVADDMDWENGTVDVGSTAIWEQAHYLDWNNCWAFGNGVESDRIRDGFNEAQLDNGVKASSVIAEPIMEEQRKYGLIWSGIYNSSSGINNTNQFIQAENITKDINPSYGSIQALINRNTRLLLFC